LPPRRRLRHFSSGRKETNLLTGDVRRRQNCCPAPAQLSAIATAVARINSKKSWALVIVIDDEIKAASESYENNHSAVDDIIV